MHKPQRKISILSFAAAILFGGLSVFAQGPAETYGPSYEATLHVVLGSDDAAQKGGLPKAIDAVTKQIRDNFAFGNYRLMNTYYGRLANNGSLEYKSVSSLQNAASDIDSPTFLDWQLTNFRRDANTTGRNTLSMQAFRFGARVPLVVSRVPGEGGKTKPVTNYESVGLTLQRISIPENNPTLIGTISLPRTTGTVFLVLTIRPV